MTAGPFSPNKTSPRWAIVQLAGRRILVPLIMVRVHVAQPQRPYRLDGPGQRPFTPSTPVRIRLGTPNEIKDLEQYLGPFFVYESGLPIICPTELEKFNKFFLSGVKRGSWGEGTDLRVRVNLPFFFLETAANIQIMRGHIPHRQGDMPFLFPLADKPGPATDCAGRESSSLPESALSGGAMTLHP